DDPKDAGVMLSTLAIGLATGVGLFLLAIGAALFAVAVLWVLEETQPEVLKLFDLKVKTKNPDVVRAGLEDLLRRNRVGFELRTSKSDELVYEVRVPLRRRTDKVSNAILELDPKGATSVQWDEKKPVKALSEA